MWLTSTSPRLPFDVILTCANQPADQTNVSELQKKAAGKRMCYTLMKKQFNIPQNGIGHGVSRIVSCRPAKAKPGPASVSSSAQTSAVDSGNRDAIVLQVKSLHSWFCPRRAG